MVWFKVAKKKESLLITVNEKEYYKQYKDIIKNCNEKGELLPTILEVVDVPEKYDFTEKELEKIKISEDMSNRRQQLFMEREVATSNIKFTGDFDKYNDELALLWNEELNNFIVKYPQFEKIIK